ncbi:hypothetical protein BSKO_12784 [Bryopsis sp. KO-2023]|nr:hypothetical protein BSKO_12784 [Bryopsis sp. KO-2023]
MVVALGGLGGAPVSEKIQRRHTLRVTRGPRKGLTIVCAEARSNGKSVAAKPPYNVVITGSTKGVGLSLAKEFLEAGDNVLISSRQDDKVWGSVAELGRSFGMERVKGMPCNVAKPFEVRNLADFAVNELGSVDLWINNAGSNAYSYKVLSEFSDADLTEVIETNLLGTMLCCREAIRIMRDQPSDGHIFNMEGAGSNGRPTPRFAAYGATKRAITHFNESLSAELKLQNINNVGIHMLQPGMCTTDLLMSGAKEANGKFFINCLAEDPEIPAKFLVPKVRNIPEESRPLLGMGGIRPQALEYLTPTKAYNQIFRRLAFGERKDRWVEE